jgi:primosomal protein N' (replication factor Y)
MKSQENKFVFQALEADRINQYKKLTGAFILVSTRQDELRLKKLLKKEIASKKIGVGTGQSLSILSDETKKIIIEKESSSAYKTIRRPFLDYRVLAEYLAEEMDIDFILGDQYLRVETLKRWEDGELRELRPLKFQNKNPIKKTLINMKKSPQDAHMGILRGGFEVLSEELIKKIEKLSKEREKMFIFSARKGHSPTTICSDCGTTVTCHKCGAPVVLHKSKKSDKENFFLCHHCGTKRSAMERCVNCGSWKLVALGIGIERVEEEIKKRFPKLNVFRIDKEKASTPKRAKDIVKNFQKADSGVLLGTELALQYIDEPLSYSAASSMDSIFSIPEFHIDERVFHLLSEIENLTEKEMLIQTRSPDQSALMKFLNNEFKDFYKEELSTRKKFNYPPFKVLIKITLEGKKPTVIKEISKVEQLLSEYQPFLFPAFVASARGKFAAHLLIKVDKNNWPDQKLSEKLLTLPQSFALNVNPESLI